MPKITLEIPEVYESITRPVAMKVLDDLLGYMNLPHKPPIVFTGGTGVEKHPGSAIGADAKKNFMFNSEAKVVLEVSEEYPEEYALQKAQLRPEENVMFSDDALGIWMKPMYQPVTVNMTFHVRTASQTQANQIVHQWKKLVSRGKQDYLHNVAYHYPIPLPAVVILCEIHRLRELVAPYNQAAGPYLKEHFSDKMTVITDQAGNNPYFAIRENQIGVLGWFDFNDTPPKFDKEADGGSWGVELTYKFQYDRCEGVAMQYPLVVHNQLLDPRFYSKEVPFEMEHFHQQANLSYDLFRSFAFNLGTGRAWSGRPGLSIPYFDDWLPDYEYPNTQCLTRILLGVDPANPKDIITLTNLGEWEFDPAAVAYMQDVLGDIFIPNGAIFHVVLYKGGQVTDVEKMNIDSDLTITYDDDLSLRGVYHLHVSLNYDAQTLHQGAIDKLAKHGAFAIKYMRMLDPRIDENGDLTVYMPDGTVVKKPWLEVQPDGSVTTHALKYAAFEASQQRWLDRAHTEYRWWLVGQYVIKAHRRG